jgi:hypothetical protein
MIAVILILILMAGGIVVWLAGKRFELLCRC